MGEYRVDLLPRMRRTEFNPAEQHLMLCAQQGGVCTAEGDSLFVVRAEVLRALVTGTGFEDAPASPIHPSGIELSNALIVGHQLNLSGAEIVAKVWLENCAFVEDVTPEQLAQGAATATIERSASAFVDLTDAQGSTLAFKNCAMTRFKAQRLRLSGNLYLDRSVISNGIDLHNSRVEGQLSCKGAKVGPHQTAVKPGDHPDGHAMDCRAAQFGNSVYLTPEIVQTSVVTIPRRGVFHRLAAIGGRGNKADPSSPLVEQPFEANGKVDFTRSSIRGRFDCRGAKIVSTKEFPEDRGRRIALHCDGIDIQASAMVGDGFSAEGEVNFVRARIGADFNAAGGSFRNQDVDAGGALNLGSARIGGSLILDEPRTNHTEPTSTLIDGRLILLQAHCEVFADGKKSAGSIGDIVTPGAGKLDLDGFVYERLAHSVTGWKARRQWLLQQNPNHIGRDFRLQPWAQLIQVLKQVGHENDARKIAINREIALRKSRSLGFWRRLTNEVLGATVGFGYRPLFPVIWSCMFLMLGWMTFDIASAKGWMAPRSEEVLVSPKYWAGEKCTTPIGYRKFHPVFYAIDLFMPITEPQLENDWGPDTDRRYCAQLKDPPVLSLQYWWPEAIDTVYEQLQLEAVFRGGGLEFVRRTLVVVGWIFVPLFLAGVSGVMKKE